MAARELLGPTGGRIMTFVSTLPDLGCGALANREDIKLRCVALLLRVGCHVLCAWCSVCLCVFGDAALCTIRSHCSGTSKEFELLNAASDWYKQFAVRAAAPSHGQVDSSRLQTSVDVFVVAAQYTDLASLSHLARFSGGSVNYYPDFSPASARTCSCRS